MKPQVKQFIPQEVCLKCKGCCRFREEDSVWLPCLLDAEVQDLIDRKDIPPVSVSIDKKIHPVPNPEGEGFACPFLNISDNKCKIYDTRPFECQLYPFLLRLRSRKVILTVDLNCPYVKENLNTEEFKEYTQGLASFLNSGGQIKILRENPHILQAYEEVLDILELKI